MKRKMVKLMCFIGIIFCGLFVKDVHATELVTIDDNTFPDENFRTYVSGKKIDVNQDGVLTVEECENVTFLGVEDVADATGIQLFTNLKEVSFVRGLEKVDLSKNINIEDLAFNYCYLDELDVSNLTELVKLNAFDCGLKEIDLTNNLKLETLYMQFNQLREIDLSCNTKLKYILLANNQLEALVLQNHPELKELDCRDNSIKELDLTYLPNIRSVKAYSNPLRRVVMTRGVAQDFTNCQLTALDVSDCIFPCDGTYENEVYGYFTTDDIIVKENCLPVQVGRNCRVYYSNLLGFDSSKVQSIAGGTCEDEYILWDGTSDKIEYVYDIGKNATRTFSIQPIFDESQEDIQNNGLENLGNGNGENAEENTEGQIAINKKIFPDEVFRKYVSDNFDKDADNYLSEKEIKQARVIKLNDELCKSISGVEYFKNLTSLDISKTSVAQIDISELVVLEKLTINNTDIESLDLSNNTKLQNLSIATTSISEIDLSKNVALTNVSIIHSELIELDISNNTLVKTVNAFDNPLRKVILGENEELAELELASCQLAVIDCSKTPNLKTVNLTNNVCTVDVGTNLRGYFEDLPDLDSLKVSEVKGGILGEDYFVFENAFTDITYYYDTGNKMVGLQQFTLRANYNASVEDIKGNSSDDKSGVIESTDKDEESGVIGSTDKNDESDGDDSLDDKDGLEEAPPKNEDSETTVNTEIQKDLSTVAITTIPMQTYCGEAITPTIEISDGTGNLVQGKDYTVSYMDNTNVGTARITIQGCGDYSGTRVLTFPIQPFDASGLSNVLKGKDGNIYRSVYKNKNIKLKTAFRIASTNNGKKVYLEPKEGVDYSIRYKNNKKIGTASIIYTFKGNYTGTLTKNFQIVPPATKVTGIKKSGSSLVVKWKKVSSGDRYEVYRATSKKGKYKKIATVKGKNNCIYKDKSAKKGKKYYYKVKACKKVKGQVYKSDYSNAKKGKR